jgi:hypothetical protein
MIPGDHFRDESQNKNAPYAHEPRPEIERFANQTEWEPDTLVDVEPTVGMEKQVASTSAPPTATPQNPKEKRPRQESSSPVTEVSSEEFNMHAKKPRTVPTTGTTVEQEITTTTVASPGVKPISSTFRFESTQGDSESIENHRLSLRYSTKQDRAQIGHF